MFFWCGAVSFSPKPTSKHSVPPWALGFQKPLFGVCLSLLFSFFFHFILMDQLYCQYRVRPRNRLGGSAGKESICKAGDLGSILGLGRSAGGGCGYPLQYSCLENHNGQRSLVDCSPWGHKESDTTEQLDTQHTATGEEHRMIEVQGLRNRLLTLPLLCCPLLLALPARV